MEKVAKVSERKVSKIHDLHPHPDNPKKHPSWQIEKLGEIIERDGYDQEIVSDEHGTILKGKGRWLSLIDRGFTKVEHVVKRGLSEDEKLAMIIVDNKIFLNEWDDEKLLKTLPKLQEKGLDTGWSETEIKQLMLKMQDEPLVIESTYDLSPRLYEKYNYILLFFTTEPDFLHVSQMLKLKKMKDRMKPKKIGVYRAIDGNLAIQMVKEHLKTHSK